MVVSLNQVNSNFFITFAVTRSISVRYDIVCRTVNYTNRSCVLREFGIIILCNKPAFINDVNIE